MLERCRLQKRLDLQLISELRQLGRIEARAKTQGPAFTEKRLRLTVAEEARRPARTASFSTCLKLCRVSWAASFRRRSTSGSRVTVVLITQS